MSTNIQVDVTLQRLRAQASQAQQQNREARSAGEDNYLSRLGAPAPAPAPDAASAGRATEERGRTPDTYEKRRPAAFRTDNIVSDVFACFAGNAKYPWASFPAGDFDKERTYGYDHGYDIWPRLRANEYSHLYLPMREPINFTSADLGALRGAVDWQYYGLRGSFLLPIDKENAIFVGFSRQADSRWSLTDTARTQVVNANYNVCAVVSTTKVRQLSVPGGLESALNRLFPTVPAPAVSHSYSWYYSNGAFGGNRTDTVKYWPTSQTMSNYTQQVYGDISKQWYTPSYGMYFFQSSAAGVNSISNSTAGGYWQLDIMTTTPAIYSYLQNYQESWYSTYDDSRTYASIAANLPLSKFKGDWLDAELSAWPAAQFSSTKLTPLSGADTGFPYIAANGTRNWTAYPAPHLENEIEPKRDPAEVAAYCWDPDCQNPQAFDTQVPQMYAYNWGNRIYCVNELSKLGFSASDLKP